MRSQGKKSDDVLQYFTTCILPALDGRPTDIVDELHIIVQTHHPSWMATCACYDDTASTDNGYDMAEIQSIYCDDGAIVDSGLHRAQSPSPSCSSPESSEHLAHGPVMRQEEEAD